MAAGEGFSTAEQGRIEQALASARDESGVDFTLFVGDVPGDVRATAERLHAALGQRAVQAALVVVAPGQRTLEIVTGTGLGRRLPDRSCALAALSMTTSFAGGDLVGGIVSGLRMLASTAGRAVPAERRTALPSGIG